jgi:glycosyltransferase involved in cell wall biosynthesis
VKGRLARDKLDSVPTVSIVIPCYLQARFLSDAIESALAQDYPAVEVIVVDDGSPDDAVGVATRYPVRYLRQENRGLSGARNAGLRDATGDLILFLDADDRLLPDAVRRGADALAARPEWAFVFGRYRMISADGVPEEPVERPGVSEDGYAWLLRYNWIGMHGTVLYRRGVLEAVGGFDESLRAAEDYQAYLRLARQHPFGSHPWVVAEYRRHGENMSRDPVRMLGAVRRVMGAERRWIGHDATWARAWRSGMRAWRREYVMALVVRSGRAIRTGDVRVLVRALPTLAWHGTAEAVSSLARKVLSLLNPSSDGAG